MSVIDQSKWTHWVTVVIPQSTIAWARAKAAELGIPQNLEVPELIEAFRAKGRELCGGNTRLKRLTAEEVGLHPESQEWIHGLFARDARPDEEADCDLADARPSMCSDFASPQPRYAIAAGKDISALTAFVAANKLEGLRVAA